MTHLIPTLSLLITNSSLLVIDDEIDEISNTVRHGAAIWRRGNSAPQNVRFYSKTADSMICHDEISYLPQGTKWKNSE